MKTTTELIDELNRAEQGRRLRIETDAGNYDGEVLGSHYSAPVSREEGVVGADVRVDGDELDGAVLEIRSTAESGTRKFSRPVARFPDDDVERAILDLTLPDA